MSYKSTSVDVLNEELRKGVVTFEYTKKDGTVRTAKGTLNDELLPEKLPDRITFDTEAIDALMYAKGINTLEEYAKANGLEYLGVICTLPNLQYEFKKAEKSHNENQVTYYDVDKDAFRSFVKNNFLGIVE